MSALPAPSERLLLVDDDEQLRDLLALVLRTEGYEVLVATSAATALAEVAGGDLALVILDIGLGGDDGRAVLGHIREQGDLPVVIISGQGEVADRVLGLRLGADDYLSKPFAPVELVARVETVLRRRRSVAPADSPAIAVIGGAPVIDEATREVTVAGSPVELTAREFDLLAFLLRSPRQVFTRSQLLAQVWDSRPDWQDEATVTEHIRRVRRKIEPDPDNPRWIVTVRGVGYRYQP